MDNIKIIIDTNAESASKSFEDLSKSFEKTNSDADDLRKQIKSLKDEIYKLTPGTEEYAKVLGELGSKMNTLGDIQRELKGASGGLDTVFQTSTVAISNLASGFQAAVGVCTLFGVESQDLMKTLVKLQAIMSIVNGLKGFAGFAKNTRTAIISIRAFWTATKAQTLALEENTVALGQNTSATNLNAGASEKAALAKGTLRAGFDKLKTAIVGVNAAMVVVVATIGLWIAALVEMYKNSKKVQAQMEENDRLIGLLSDETLTYTERNKKLDSEFQAQLKTYAKITKNQEALIDVQKRYYTEQLRLAKSTREAAIEQARFYETTTACKEELEEAQKAIQESTDRIKELESAIRDLEAQDLTGWSKKMIDEFEDFDRGVSRSLARGEISDSAAIKRRIKKRQDMINVLNEIETGYYTGQAKDFEGRMAEIEKAQEKARSYGLYNILGSQEELNLFRTRLRDEIDDLSEALEDYNDRQFRAASEAYKNLLESQAQEFEKFTNEFDKENDKAWTSVQTFDEEMQQLFENIGLNGEEAQGRARNSLSLIIKEIDDFTAQWKQKAIDLLSANKISKESFNEFMKELNANAVSMKELATHLTDDLQLTDYAVVLNNHLLVGVNDLKKTLTTLDVMQKEGLISSKEYQNAYIKAISDFKDSLGEESTEIEDYINRILSGEMMDDEAFTDINGNTQTLREFLENNGLTTEGYVEMLRSLFEQSATVLPPEFYKKMTDNVRKIIDAQMKDIEDEYDKEVFRIKTEITANGNNIFSVFWGAGEGQDYQNLKAGIEETFKAYEEMYNEEVASLEHGMSLYDEDTDEYRFYLEKKKELDEAYKQAHEQYLQDLEENEHTHLKNLMSNIGNVTSATSSLGSALSDYYDEMANDERLSTEEQKKYTIKSLRMKKFQAVANVASGIVAAIAGAMELGFPMGPIMAAIESASVAVAGAAQIKSINRQIRELGGSSGDDSTATANVGQLTDRVIMADAQNTDQTAQLNAQYNQGNMRVYVTQNDIENANNENRVAVTSNKF